MTKKPTNPVTALPLPERTYDFPGMSLRDYFAAQALPAVIRQCISYECFEDETMAEMFARKTYEAADAMLAERSK